MRVNISKAAAQKKASYIKVDAKWHKACKQILMIRVDLNVPSSMWVHPSCETVHLNGGGTWFTDKSTFIQWLSDSLTHEYQHLLLNKIGEGIASYMLDNFWHIVNYDNEVELRHVAPTHWHK